MNYAFFVVYKRNKTSARKPKEAQISNSKGPYMSVGFGNRFSLLIPIYVPMTGENLYIS